MKYAAIYNKNLDLDNIDELILDYSENKHRTSIIDFIKNNKRDNLRFIIVTEKKELDSKDIEIFKAIKEIHNNIAIRINVKDLYLSVDFIDKDIQFFVNDYVFTWDAVAALMKYGVSDIYIIHELGFQLKRIKEMNKDINIRVFPNVAQTSETYNVLPTIKSFFIRPEDTDFYEKYVDVFEFFGPSEKNNVLLRIYKNKKWNGNLKDIISGFKEDIPNKTIVPHFGERRANCNKVCSYNKCNLCNQICNLAKSLDESGITIITKEANNE